MAKPVWIGETAQRVLRGEEDYSSWSLPELVRGQRKSRRGKWEGRQPKVVPVALLHEINRRVAPEVYRTLLAGAMDAAEYMRAVAAGEIEADANRTHVCQIILNRLYGTAPQHVTLEFERKPYELVQRSTVNRELGSYEDDDVIDVQSFGTDD